MSRRIGVAETIAAFAVGIGVGAALGILFAPKSGEELREDLAGNASQMADSARDRLNQAVSQGREWTQRAGKAADQAVSQVNDLTEQVRDKVNSAADAGNRAYKEAKNSAS